MAVSGGSDRIEQSPIEALQLGGGLASFIRSATKEGNQGTFADSSPMMNLPQPAQVAQICGNLQLTG